MIVAMVLGIFVIQAWSKNPDTDSYFLAATGRYIIDNGFPKTNPFSAAGGNIVVQQWVMCIVNYALFAIFGAEIGTWLYGIFAYLLAALALGAYASTITKDPAARALSVLSGLIIYIGGYGNSRPTSLSFPLFLLMLIVLEKKTKHIWLYLPAISVLMVNIHASMWPFIFVLSLPYLLPETLLDNIFWKLPKRKHKKNYWQEHWTLILGLAFSIPAGLLNPYGLNGMLYLFRSYGQVSSLNIIELQQPTILSYYGVFIVLSIILFVSLLPKMLRIRKRWCRMSMLGGTLLMAMLHSRNASFLCFGLIPTICVCIEKANLHFPERMMLACESLHKEKKQIGAFSGIFLSAVLIFAAAGMLPLPVIYDKESTPADAFDYLDSLYENEEEKPAVLTTFNNGAYAEWRGYEGYIDARPEIYAEPINGADVLGEYEEMCKTGDCSEVIEKYGFSYVIVSEDVNLTICTWAKYQEETGTLEKCLTGNGYILYKIVAET